MNGSALRIFLLMTVLNTALSIESPTCTKDFNCINDSKQKQNDSCARSCEEDCHYMFMFRYNKKDKESPSLEFKLFAKSKETEIHYAGASFSTDRKMGDDMVIYCAKDPAGSSVATHLGHTNGYSLQNINLPNAKEVFVDVETGQNDSSAIYCKGRINLEKSGEFKLNEQTDYYILLAHGSMAGSAAQHHDSKFASATALRIDVDPSEQNTTCGGDTGASLAYLSHFHGASMITAWLLFSSFAIFSARYRRTEWTDNVCGTQLWFTVHRTLNVLALLFMGIGAFSIGLVKDFRWDGPWFSRDMSYNLSVRAIHSLVGAIAVAFAFLQPLNALLRCKPNAPLRPIFNFVHRSSGLFALSLAYVAIFLALYEFVTIFYNHKIACVAFGVAVTFGVAVIDLGEMVRHRKPAKSVKTGQTTDGSGLPTPSGEPEADNESSSHPGCDFLLYLCMGVFLTAAAVMVALILIPPYE